MNTHPVHAPGNAIAQRNLHPVLWVAAIAVILASFAAVGAIFGWIPGSGARNAEPLATASAPQALPETPAPAQLATAPAVTAPAPAAPAKSSTGASSARPVHKSKPHPVAQDDDYRPAPVAAVCADCGTIDKVRTIQHEGEGTGLGAVGGAVIGGVLGNQVGEGNGKRAARIGGAVLGGLAGHQVEKRVRSGTSWEVDVRMNDGATRTVSYTQQPTWQPGDPVRVENGEIHAR
ncbi:glycine zipper 2TM domain-containing protein [Niveibacterium sp. SC-1]|uniref:glycine zipper 2TM domain-containing protein n=1 Tax=Niveibacterium sp. SC-1 TaxID=3135646 RepID=UPI00311D8DF3